MNRLTSIVVCPVVFVFAVYGAAQEATTLDEALAALGGVSTEVKSWTADLSMQLTMSGVKLAYTGTTKMMGDLSASNLTVNMQGRTLKSLVVMDPNGVQWSESDIGGVKQITKIDMVRIMSLTGDGKVPIGLGPGAPVDVTRRGADIVREYQDSFDVVFKGANSVGGAKAYLFEGTVKPGKEGTGELASLGLSAHRFTLAIGREDGVLRAMEMFDKAGDAFLSLLYENLKVNPELSADEFRYTPPAGAAVKDITDQAEAAVTKSGTALP